MAKALCDTAQTAWGSSCTYGRVVTTAKPRKVWEVLVYADGDFGL